MIKPTKLSLAVPALVAGLVVVSCGSGTGSSIFPSDVDAGTGNTGTGPTGSLGKGSPASCDGTSVVEGCACEPQSGPQACWTGPAADRHRGACKDGTAQCVKTGEFSAWGPCQGQVLDCGTAGTTGGGGDAGGTGNGGNGGEDAGNGNGGNGGEDAGGVGNGGGGGETAGRCACVPGAVMWCDEDCSSAIYCKTDAQRECLPDGTWGKCHEVSQEAPISACKIVGLGCSTCNNGIGYLTGDCASVFTCPTAVSTTCSAGANVNNGVATVTCNCN